MNDESRTNKRARFRLRVPAVTLAHRMAQE